MGWFTKDEEEETSEDEEESEDEEDNDEVYEETYTVDYECANCPNQEEYEIKKGITFKEYLKDKICENCGCPLISKEDKK